MPRARNPNRAQAYQIWKEHDGKITNRQIADLLGENEKVVAVWKQRDKWNVVQQSNESCTTNRWGAPKGNKNAIGHGAPKGNKNAKGNRGGTGGPKQNKKALKTGEYETIWFDSLDEEEQGLIDLIDTDPFVQATQAVVLLSIRERRMMHRINNLKNGLTDRQKRVLQERKEVPVPVEVDDDKTGGKKVIVKKQSEMVVVQVEEMGGRAIQDIISLEEALTRVQDRKAKYIELQLKFMPRELRDEEQRLRLEKLKAEIARMKGDDNETEDDGFLEALDGKVDEAWSDDNES